MGVRHANGAKGDLIAEVQIVLPAAADEDATRLLEAAKVAEAGAAAKAGAADPRAGLRW
jgi:phage major head subunit gpT-like protein